MIVVGKYVLWSYIHSLQDADHHASVMVWSKGTEPRLMINSAFSASNLMFHSQGETIYFIERRYRQEAQVFEVRILKNTIGEDTEEIWPWFEDK